MSPEDVPAEWVEKAARAIYEAAAMEAYHDPEQTLDEGDWPEWDVEDPFFGDLLRDARHALAAVLPLAQAEAWKQGALTADPNLDPSVADEYNPYREGSGGEG